MHLDPRPRGSTPSAPPAATPARPPAPAFPDLPRYRPIRRIEAGSMGAVWAARDEVRRARVAFKVLSRAGPGALAMFKREFRALAHLAHPHLVTMFDLGSSGGVWYLTMELVEGGNLRDYVQGPAAVVVGGEAAGRAPVGHVATDRSTVAMNSVQEEESAPTLAAARSDGLEADRTAPVRCRVTGAPRPDRDALDRLRRGLLGTALGLQALHEAGKLHRDLKPSNPDSTAARPAFGGG